MARLCCKVDRKSNFWSRYCCKKKNTAAEDKIWSGSRNIWVQAPKKPLQTFICLWMHPSFQLIVESPFLIPNFVPGGSDHQNATESGVIARFELK